MPSLVQWHEDEKPEYSDGNSAASSAQSRMPLDVPPELRAEVSVPMPAAVAPHDKQAVILPTLEKKSIAGKAVALDARLYDLEASKVFSAVIDAMTALNRPVQSVDSPSGTVTSDWIRDNVDNANASNGDNPIRYRFVVRVLRQDVDGLNQTRLEIRTMGQRFINRHWVNRTIQRKVSEELFVAVEDRLNVQAQAKPKQGQEQTNAK